MSILRAMAEHMSDDRASCRVAEAVIDALDCMCVQVQRAPLMHSLKVHGASRHFL